MRADDAAELTLLLRAKFSVEKGKNERSTPLELLSPAAAAAAAVAAAGRAVLERADGNNSQFFTPQTH
jgi:hypothetical protein